MLATGQYQVSDLWNNHLVLYGILISHLITDSVIFNKAFQTKKKKKKIPHECKRQGKSLHKTELLVFFALFYSNVLLGLTDYYYTLFLLYYEYSNFLMKNICF